MVRKTFSAAWISPALPVTPGRFGPGSAVWHVHSRSGADLRAPASSCGSGTPSARTDLPATKQETLECLNSYLPKLAVTYGAAMATGPGLPMPEFEQATARVADGIDPDLAPHTVPTYRLGSDPIRTRTELEDAFVSAP